MIDATELGAGLGIIAVQTRHPLDVQTIDAYHLVLGDETEPDEWLRFCRVAVRKHAWRFFPPVVDIVAALEQLRGERTTKVDQYSAVRALLPEEARGALDGLSTTTPEASEAERRRAIEHGSEILAGAVKALPPMLPTSRAILPAETKATVVVCTDERREELKRALEDGGRGSESLGGEGP